MKLETSEVEREDWGKIAAGSDVGTDEFMTRLLRDIDTLLAEVERLREDSLFKTQVELIASLYAKIDARALGGCQGGKIPLL